MASSNSNSLFPAFNSPQRQSSTSAETSSKRNKVALPKGRSLMDWIRLGNSGADLTGLRGRLIRVTADELAKHNSREDCWMAIGGAVYNITKYCEYHPGGVAEIMKGAGKDGTQLFNEVHRWVNYESMLKKCLVGKLVTTSLLDRAPQYGTHLAPPRAVGTSLQTVNRPQADQTFATPAPVTSTTGNTSFKSASNTVSSLPFTAHLSQPSDKPRYDYFQSDRAVKICIYTRREGIGRQNVIVERPDGQIVKISVILPDTKIYRLHVAPSHVLLTACELKVVETIGKIELDFPKAEHGVKWTRLGVFLDKHDTLLDSCDTDYFNCTVTTVESVTHDTKLFTISLPEGSHMLVPVGKHIRIKSTVSDVEVIKSYTPVIYLNQPVQSQQDTLLFLIKIYSDGAMTPELNRLNPGDSISVSYYAGEFSTDRLTDYNRLLLLAAGTGFTPMVKLVQLCVSTKTPCHLVFFNKTQQDIMWREQLDLATSSSQGLLHVTHVLSQPDDSWKGSSGRLSTDLLQTLLYNPPETSPNAEHNLVGNLSDLLVAVCGPIPFNELATRLLKEQKLADKNVYIFE